MIEHMNVHGMMIILVHNKCCSNEFFKCKNSGLKRLHLIYGCARLLQVVGKNLQLRSIKTMKLKEDRQLRIMLKCKSRMSMPPINQVQEDGRRAYTIVHISLQAQEAQPLQEANSHAVLLSHQQLSLMFECKLKSTQLNYKYDCNRM